jgi:hypothetical protein
LSDFNEIETFSTDFPEKIIQMPNFMKIRSVGVELFSADWRRDRLPWRNWTSLFRSFAKVT